MKNESDGNYISVGSWMWMMFVTAIPCIGLIMIFVWAFAGDNESRKNYYRALLVWFGVFVALFVILAAVGQWPPIQKHLEDLIHKR
jgi:heme/copper-type cytochrome/quinol oxidase subunit 2